MTIKGEHWRIDVDRAENFWVISDAVVTDSWVLTMVCGIKGRTKTDRPAKNFINMMGEPHRNAWSLTPFSLYGYVTVIVQPDIGDSFTILTGKCAR